MSHGKYFLTTIWRLVRLEIVVPFGTHQLLCQTSSLISLGLTRTVCHLILVSLARLCRRSFHGQFTAGTSLQCE